MSVNECERVIKRNLRRKPEYLNGRHWGISEILSNPRGCCEYPSVIAISSTFEVYLRPRRCMQSALHNVTAMADAQWEVPSLLGTRNTGRSLQPKPQDLLNPPIRWKRKKVHTM